MSRFTLLVLLLAGMAAGLTSCDKEDDPQPAQEGIFELNFITKVSGLPFGKEIVFENINGIPFYISRFQLYLSDIMLVDKLGNEQLLSEVELFDMTTPGSNKVFHGEGTFVQFPVKAGDFAGLKFSFGVKKALNHEDPADFAQDHPLSVFNEMHWNWQAGYKFMVIEGKIDSTAAAAGNEFGKPLVYHTGLDTLYRSLSYLDAEDAFTIENGKETQFTIELDLNRLFFNQQDTLNMVKFAKSHTVPPGSEEFKTSLFITDNLVNNALFKRPF